MHINLIPPCWNTGKQAAPFPLWRERGKPQTMFAVGAILADCRNEAEGILIKNKKAKALQMDSMHNAAPFLKVIFKYDTGSWQVDIKNFSDVLITTIKIESMDCIYFHTLYFYRLFYFNYLSMIFWYTVIIPIFQEVVIIRDFIK